jgi:hypothetical protein
MLLRRFKLTLLAMVPLALALVSQPGVVVPAQGMNWANLPQIEKRLISGPAAEMLDPTPAANPSTAGAGPRTFTPVVVPQSYTPVTGGCPETLGGNNIKVNQNCLNITDADLQGRGQAQNETSMAIDPSNPTHLLASYNDYRRGDGNCYGTYSLDNGQTWTDTTVPMGFTRGTAFGEVARQYWQSGGDTAVAYDSKGNAYFQCQVFMRGAGGLTNNPDQSSAVYVFRSTGNAGASWNFPARPAIEKDNRAGNPAVLEDKPYMTVDNHAGSPFQDRIYVTYTEFAADGTGYIWEVHSSDYGETFSAPVLVSAQNGQCVTTYGLPTPHGKCNENQFSDPFVGSDGNLYVVYSNFNNSLANASDNHNTIVMAKSTDGGVTFAKPIGVNNYNDAPDCATYQGGADAGRGCFPESGGTNHSIFRVDNYPTGVVNPNNPNQIFVTFGSYINRADHVNCTPNGLAGDGLNLYNGVKSACANKILFNVSNNAGATWVANQDPTATPLVSQASSQASSDQWFQWAATTSTGTLAVSYYDRQYGSDQSTGNMDFTLGTSTGLAAYPGTPLAFANTRATSSSMPPPTAFGGVFFGDYTGLAALNDAHPIWSDTRDADLTICGSPPTPCTFSESSGPQNGLPANDEDIFTRTIATP